MSQAAYDRPLGIRRNSNVAEAKHQNYFGTTWMLRDNASLKYTRLLAPELFLWKSLDGELSPRQLIERFRKRYPTREMDHAKLIDVLQRFAAGGLLTIPGRSAVEELTRRTQRQKQQEWKSQMLSFWAIRFPGINVDWLLTLLSPWFGWFWSWPAFVLRTVFVLFAAILVWMRWPEIWAEIPTMREFLADEGWIAMVVAFSFIKIAHELGHGLACKWAGRSCREIGVLLLLLTPTLYCDVSDLHMSRNWLKRMTVMTAGVLVELVIAAGAAIWWFYLPPGILRNVCLFVAVTCSVGTLLTNFNPLLRYDGYYIATEIFATPEL